jgi:hypothetical protein
MRPYNSGPTLKKLRHYSQSDHKQGCYSSHYCQHCAISQLDVSRRRRRRHVPSWFHPTPSFPQTAGSHADPARRAPHSVVHMACLDIAVGSVLRLAECPSGHGLACGERSLPVCRMPAKSLASVARQSDPCTHALSLSTLELSVSRFDQDLLTTTPHMHDGRQVSASFGPMVRNSGCNVGAKKSPSGFVPTSVHGYARVAWNVSFRAGATSMEVFQSTCELSGSSQRLRSQPGTFYHGEIRLAIFRDGQYYSSQQHRKRCTG